MLNNSELLRIESIVRSHLSGFATGFKTRHFGELENPQGTLNLKKQNVFVRALPGEFIYYSALVRSFDSAFGGLLEKLAIEIAREYYEVSQEVSGQISARQIDYINDILTNYKNKDAIPDISHYSNYSAEPFSLKPASHASDHLFFDKKKNTYHIVELKAGGDLDIKKAEVEKRALLEQYFILRNTTSSDIKLHFATAYNKFGEGNDWAQERVQRFFAAEELLIGKDFWNFVCKDDTGFAAVLSAYTNNIGVIVDALSEIKEAYNI
ncbi:MAG: TdeIII family type II restriction endonuclease [Oscillospiraceae bacterium]|nr:TdeIII family type II restriction endonuclease [Oscillospiraceae bacterium]